MHLGIGDQVAMNGGGQLDGNLYRPVVGNCAQLQLGRVGHPRPASSRDPRAASDASFYDLQTGGTPAPITSEALVRIAGLYAVEADGRRRARQTRSKSIIETRKPWLERQLTLVSRKSPQAEAIRYALSRWDGLCHFLDDDRVEIDSKVVERAIRPITTMRSLCTPLSSVSKHCKLVFWHGATRAGCPLDRGGHPFTLQVCGSNLVRRAKLTLQRASIPPDRPKALQTAIATFGRA
jgi:hypothetical protein